LIAGDARDVDFPSVVVIEDITLHGHRTLVLEIVEVVQCLEWRYTVLASFGFVVIAAVVGQLQEDNVAWRLIVPDRLSDLGREMVAIIRLICWPQPIRPRGELVRRVEGFLRPSGRGLGSRGGSERSLGLCSECNGSWMYSLRYLAISHH
jgi:hypothetical protein